MIVKVQISLATSMPNRRVLVYNERRSIMYEDDATPEIIKLLNGSPKGYFKAHLNDDDMLILDGPAEPQNW